MRWRSAPHLLVSPLAARAELGVAEPRDGPSHRGQNPRAPRRKPAPVLVWYRAISSVFHAGQKSVLLLLEHGMEAEPLVEPSGGRTAARALARAGLSAPPSPSRRARAGARARARARARAPGGALATARARQQRPSPAAARWLSLSVRTRRAARGAAHRRRVSPAREPRRDPLADAARCAAATGRRRARRGVRVGDRLGLAAGAGSAPAALSARGDAVEATFVALGAHAVRVTAASTRAVCVRGER